MKFDRLEAIDILGKRDGNRLFQALNVGYNHMASHRTKWVPTTRHENSETLKKLNVYDTGPLLEIYESRLTSPTHGHLTRRTIEFIKMLTKIKESA